MNQEKEAQSRYKEACKTYNIALQQKPAKLHWLKEGDENSKLLYISIKVSYRRNAINAIHNEAVCWVDTPKGVAQAFIGFYQGLLGECMSQ